MKNTRWTLWFLACALVPAAACDDRPRGCTGANCDGGARPSVDASGPDGASWEAGRSVPVDAGALGDPRDYVFEDNDAKAWCGRTGEWVDLPGGVAAGDVHRIDEGIINCPTRVGATPNDDVDCECATYADPVACTFGYSVTCEHTYGDPRGSTRTISVCSFDVVAPTIMRGTCYNEFDSPDAFVASTVPWNTTWMSE